MTYGSDAPHTQAQHGRVPPPMPPRKPRRQRSREEILHEQVKRTERELARLRREMKDVTSAPAQSSTAGRVRRKAHMQRMALKSAKARRRRKT